MFVEVLNSILPFFFNKKNNNNYYDPKKWCLAALKFVFYPRDGYDFSYKGCVEHPSAYLYFLVVFMRLMV